MLAADPALPPPMQVVYSSQSGDGDDDKTIGTTLPGENVVVTVLKDGEYPESVRLQLGTQEIPVKKIVQDPISRLEFLSVDQGQKLHPIPWNTEVGKNANAPLRTLEPDGAAPCRSTGWVKHVGKKVLPFALLNVDFSHGVPLPGTAVVDDRGAVVGIVFQASGTGNNGYVIPVEAILRVRHDLVKGGVLIRGWLGLALHTGVHLPQISRILADSPAAEAGIQVGDIIVSVGAREVTDYADAANAFFYVIPGKPVALILHRGEQTLKITLMPTKPPADL